MNATNMNHTETLTTSSTQLTATTSTDTTVRLWDFGKENDGTFACTKTLLGHDHTVSFATYDLFPLVLVSLSAFWSYKVLTCFWFDSGDCVVVRCRPCCLPLVADLYFVRGQVFERR